MLASTHPRYPIPMPRPRMLRPRMLRCSAGLLATLLWATPLLAVEDPGATPLHAAVKQGDVLLSIADAP